MIPWCVLHEGEDALYFIRGQDFRFLLLLLGRGCEFCDRIVFSRYRSLFDAELEYRFEEIEILCASGDRGTLTLNLPQFCF